MKKNYFMLAATAALFAACAETDLVNEIAVEETPQAIGFETFANKQTRADDETPAAVTTALATHHDAYKVWAYKNTQNSTLVFNAEEVTASDNTYTETQYWDKAATNYYFYAAAPALAVTENGLTFNESTTGTEESTTTNQDKAYFSYNQLTLSGTNFSNTTSLSTTPQTTFISKDNSTSKQTITDVDVDYMIANTPVSRNNNGGYTNPVGFDFKHILSRLNITIKANDDTPTIKLTKLSLHGLKNKATFNSQTETFTSRWTSASTDTYNGYKVSSDAGITVPTTASYILECLLIPQIAKYQFVALAGENSYNEQAPYIHVQYTIDSEIFDAYYNLAALFGATLDDKETAEQNENEVTFSEAYQSTLNITFSPQGITFTTATTDWVAENTTTDDKTID